MKRVMALDAETIRVFVKNHLEPGCTIQTDGLNIYAGKEHQSFVVSKGAEPLGWINTVRSFSTEKTRQASDSLGPF